MSMTAVVKFCLGMSVASGVAMATEIVLPSALPNMPEGYGTWGPAALLAFVCIFGLSVTAWLCYLLFKALLAQSGSILEMAKAIASLTAKLDVLQAAIAEGTDESRATNKYLLTLAGEVHAKPCQDPRFPRFLEHLEQLDRMSAR